METAILVYVGTDLSAVGYSVESFNYVFSAQDENRSVQVLRSHGEYLMNQWPRQFLMVPEDSSVKVNLLGAPIAQMTGVHNLDTETKGTLIEAGFKTAGELLTLTPMVLATHLPGKDENYVKLMQDALKERFGIPTDLSALNAARGSTEPLPDPASVTPDNLTSLNGLGEVGAGKLVEAGIKTFAQLSQQTAEHVAEVIGGSVTPVKAQSIIDEAKEKTAS